MTGPCPFGFGPGAPTPYTYNNINPHPQQTQDYPPFDWRSNAYAPTHAQMFPHQYEVQPYTVCPKQIVYENKLNLCRGHVGAAVVAGQAAGVYASVQAVQPYCEQAAQYRNLCYTGAVVAGGVVGAGLGFYSAMDSSACNFIVDGGGQCVDASHNHPR